MSHVADHLRLVSAVLDGNFDMVKAALRAGASVDGFPRASLITTAAIAGAVDMVDFLLKRGADPDGPTYLELPCQGLGKTTPGERALHIAARIGSVEIARLLLPKKKRGRADPNATDSKGRTPLLVASESSHACVDLVRLLLEEGADPARADLDGLIPLHFVALEGRIDLFDMLYPTEEPPHFEVLNRCTTTGKTPLFKACARGHEGMVSRLLSLGAVQRGVNPNECNMCPLVMAAARGHAGVVRALLDEGGLRRAIIDGETAMARALEGSVRFRHTRVLRLLLEVDGEEGRAKWANTNLLGRQLLHDGTGYCCPAAVSILLSAGADETALDVSGLLPGDGIGLNDRSLKSYHGEQYEKDRGQAVAIRRMLLRAPAYRARSWAWPSSGDDEAEQAGAGGSGCDSSDPDTADTAAAAAAVSTVAVLSSPPAGAKTVLGGVRLLRPKANSGREVFVRLVDRYCAKD